MKAEYDLSQMKSRKNPYASKLKKSVTISLSEDVMGYFKDMAEKVRVYLIKAIEKLIFLGSQPQRRFKVIDYLLDGLIEYSKELGFTPQEVLTLD